MKVGDFEVRLHTSAVDSGLYATATSILNVVNRLYFRLEIKGDLPLPEPPYIIAPTHRSYLDTILMASLTRRRLRYMGKEELWKYPFLAKVMGSMGGIPVSRGTPDRNAVEASIRILQAGQSLVLFPEGTRRHGPIVTDLLDGAAYIALKARVPVIPIGIAGSEGAMSKGAKFPRPVKCIMSIGPAILDGVEGDPDQKRIARSRIRVLTDRLRNDLQAQYDMALEALGQQSGKL
ncbi:lysophospholipid acyltransferase family protein [Acidithrix sp. C25]|nr:lysophospholipid acyltransferase family protein [Acidithrix sp. C25]